MKEVWPLDPLKYELNFEGAIESFRDGTISEPPLLPPIEQPEDCLDDIEMAIAALQVGDKMRSLFGGAAIRSSYRRQMS